MKRLILSVTGTVAGLVALLSFKSQAHPITSAAALPSAVLGTAASSSTAGTPSPGAAPSGTAAASSGPSPSSSTAASKTYLGSSITTRYGVIQVEVVVQAGKITHVSFAQLTAFDGRSEQINSNAAPQLLQETLTAQSAQVDSVSGASYTSDGYRQSLQSALDKAGIR